MYARVSKIFPLTRILARGGGGGGRGGSGGGGGHNLIAKRPYGWTHPRVADSGPGIPADKHKKLFQKFTQLGLSVVISTWPLLMHQHCARRAPKYDFLKRTID